jgi:two-component system response regulator
MTKDTILLVEDNASDELLTLRALRKNQILNTIDVARDGAEALDYLLGRGAHANEVPPLPRVVLLDLNLPKVGGLEVLKELRANERTRRLPVVILTSSKEDRDLLEGYGSGANSYIVKPVDFAKFVEAVRQIGLYWLLLNQPP